MSKAGLIPELAQQLRFAKDIYHSRQFDNVSYVLSFAPVEHHIFFRVKEAARTEAEWGMLERDTTGVKFGLELDTKENLKRLFDPSWVFNCPICGTRDSLVTELDFDPLVTDRCACVSCGFAVTKGAPYVSQVIWLQIDQERARILREYH